MRLLLNVVGALFLSFVATTYIALESDGVVVVETYNAGTSILRRTHVWYVPEQGKLLLEAGNPQNSWVQDLENRNVAHIYGEGLDGEYRFTRFDSDSHGVIRKKMRERYGWRDWWVSFLFDTSESFMIEAIRSDT